MAEAQGTLVLTVDTEQSASGFEKFLAGGQRVVDAFKKVKETVDQAFELIDASVQMKRLEASLPTGALQRMRETTRGLVSDVELLKVSAKAMTGDFKLTEKQMEMVAKAAMVLSGEGRGSFSQVADKIAELYTEPSQEKLKKLGLDVKLVGNQAIDAERIYAALQRRVSDGRPMDQAHEHLLRLKADWENSMQRMKESVAPLATTLVTNLVPAINQVTKALGPMVAQMEKASAFAGAISGYKELGFKFGIGGTTWNRDIMLSNQRDVARRLRAQDPDLAEIGALEESRLDLGAMGNLAAGIGRDVGGGYYGTEYDSTGRRSPSDTSWTFADALRPRSRPISDAVNRTLDAYRAYGGGSLGVGGGVADLSGISAPAASVGWWGGGPLMTSAQQREQDAAEKQKRMEGRFAALSPYGDALGSSLSSGFMAATEAAIAGGESIAKAWRKAMGESLKASAIRMGGTAIEMGVGALVQLAIGNGPGAAAAGVAAGAAAAQAAVLGGLAASLGVGGGGGSAGVRPGGYGGSAGGRIGGQGQGGGNQTIIINVAAAGPGSDTQGAVMRGLREANQRGRNNVVSYE